MGDYGRYEIMYIIIDTNIILLDHLNITTLGADGSIIVLPETVINETDSKKSVPGELGYQARSFGRMIARGTINDPFTVEDLVITPVLLDCGTTIHITSSKCYPDFSDLDSSIINDRKIIEIALQYHNIYGATTFMSNDVMCRISATSLGLPSEDLKVTEKTSYEFVKPLEVADPEVFRTLHNSAITDIDPDYKPEHYSYKFESTVTGQVKLATVVNGTISIIGKDSEKELRQQDAPPINSEQLLLSAAIHEPTNDIIICDAKSGSGKAQPLSEKVLTPKGWTTMGTIAVGSEVIGSDGTAKQVLGVYPQGIRDVYEVTFIDGTKVRCDKHHLWSVRTRSKGNFTKFEPTTVEDMLNSWVSKEYYDKRYDSYQNTYNYSIQPASPCHYGEDTTKQTIDPYALGLLLGDGSFRSDRVSFTSGNKAIVDKLKQSLEPEYTLSDLGFSKGAYYSNVVRGTATIPFIKVIEGLGLKDHKSEDKFVPNCYMNGSLTTRSEVYQGLVDTDGYVKNGKVLEYSTSSESLARDYIELSRSIGKVCTVSSRIPKYTYKGELLEGTRSYRIREMKVKPKSITSITKVGAEESQCIMIDSDDHLYVTAGYNLTHNTVTAVSNAIKLVKKGKFNSILYIRNTIDDVSSQEEEIGFLSTNEAKEAVYLHALHDTLDFIVRKRLSNSKSKGKELEDKVAEGVVKLTTDCDIQAMIPLGMRGRTFTDSIIIVDEVQNMPSATLQKILTRIGKNSKVILIGSQNQIDSSYLTRFNNGLAILLDAATKPADVQLFATTLHKVARSPICEFAETLYSKEQ